MTKQASVCILSQCQSLIEAGDFEKRSLNQETRFTDFDGEGPMLVQYMTYASCKNTPLEASKTCCCKRLMPKPPIKS